jgi:esterase/lipase superfamily enzyme
MEREYHRWWSERLGRDMELLVFGRSGARVLVFPTRGGRFFDYENWGLVAALRPSIEWGNIQLFCLDSVDYESLYAFGRPPHERIARHLAYEGYVLHEVLPLSERMNGSQTLIAHGCSLGAFHAANIAFRHPQRFAKVVAFSGRFDLTTRIGRYRPLFDGYYDEAIYFNTPCHYLPQLEDATQLAALRRLEIVLGVGEADFFLENNQRLSTILWEKGVWNALRIWEGEAHCAAHWREVVALYL